jgi:hypothetical protein
MDITRRSFEKWGMGALALAALKPSWLLAQASGGFEGFGLTAAGKLKTRTSASIKASPLSVGYETLDRQHFDPNKTYALAAQLGVKWARCQTGWARCEKTRGVYDFGWLDEVVDGLLKIGIQPWFNLGYGNPLYTPKADATAVGWVPVFDDAAMEGWKAYTAKLAEHFKDRVKHWEIWNEPNITGFWKPGQPDAASYVKLVEQTAPLLRERVPGAVLIGGGFSGIPMKYYEACLEAGLAKHVDKISYHPYRPSPEKGYEDEVKKMRELLKKHGAEHVKLWQGENGCPSQKGSAGALSQQDWNETRQAKWVTRRILSDLRLEVELTSYFLIVDLIGYRGKVNLKGLLRGEDYSPKPAYYAYQNLCALFDAETRRSKITFKIEGAGETATVAAGFTRHGKPLVAYWAVEDLTKDAAPRKVQVLLGEQEKAQMPRPALLDPLTGQIYKVSSFDALPLADYPLILGDENVFA